MSIVNKLKAIADIITPPAGYKTLFFRDDTGVPAVKDENGVVSDLVIPGDASGVTFTPQDAHNWTDSVDPGNVDDALNDLAVRVNTLETAEAPDAAIVTYTPTTAADWDGDVDPGDAQEALDQLAERVTDIEETPGSGSSFGTIVVSGQSNVVADSSSDTLTLVAGSNITITTDAGGDSVTITAAGAGSVDASAVTYTPSHSINWTDSEDPGNVDTALDDLAARLQGIEERDAALITQCIAIACSDETTALTTGTAKATFRMPHAFTLTEVRASVTTAPTGATLLTVDINENTGGGATSILSTKLTFDASEKTTKTASIPAVISDANLADDSEMTVDIDAVGSTITGAGLKIYLIGYT